MPVRQTRPLLITSRLDFAQRITDCAPDVELTTAAPDTVSAATWTTASAVFVDAQAALTLCSRGLPVHHRTQVVTDAHPAFQDWSNALALHAERMIELPSGGPWLAAALHAAAHRATVIAVIGVGPDGTDTASTVAAAIALDHLHRDEHVALVGLRPDSTTLQRQLDSRCTATEPGPPRAGGLSLIVRDGQQPLDIGETCSLIAGLSGDHDVIVLDVPPPLHPAGTEAIAKADIVLTVATPDELPHPEFTGAVPASTGQDDDNPYGPALDEANVDRERRWHPHPHAVRHARALLAGEPAADLAVIMFQPGKTVNWWVSGQQVRTVFGVVLLSQNTFTPTGLIPGHSWARDAAARIAAERLHAWAAEHSDTRAED